MSRRSIDPELPVRSIRTGMDVPGCTRARGCVRMTTNIANRLVGRYIGVEAPVEDQIPAAVIDLRGLTWDDYLGVVKKRYKGNVVRDARKSDKQGYRCRPFARALHVPDLVAINHSKDERCGKPMKETYLKSVSEMGGAPKRHHEVPVPECPCHYDRWWGVFEPVEGYTQGEVVTDERLVAYIDFRRVGEFALYSLILGHGDYLKHGVMYRLHFEIMQHLLAREDAATRGIEQLMYAGFYQGGDGLQRWKKKTAFEPVYLVTPDPSAPEAPGEGAAVTSRGWWGRVRNHIGGSPG